MSAGIGFEIFSADASFKTSTSDTTSLDFEYDLTIPAGQTGFIVWTPFIQHTSGTLTGCSTGVAAACFPIKDGQR